MSFSQECRRHDCQKSSELSSAESSMISRSDHGSRGCGGSQGVRKGRKAATRSPAGVHFACCSSKAVPGIAAQSAGAAVATQGAQCKEARAGTPYVRLTAACVSSNTRHHAAVLRAMQGEAEAARAAEVRLPVFPKVFACSVRAAVRCAICLLSEIVNCEMARLGGSSVSRCEARLHRRCLKSGPIAAVTKNSHV